MIRPIGQIRFLTIHCAATPEGRDVKAVTVRQWGINRFNQPSYHWIIELNGTAVRDLPDIARGAHTRGANTGNIGICYVGGMAHDMKRAKDTRTPAQTATLGRLVRQYQARFPGLVIRGHRDWPGVDKDCPSFDVAAWLKAEGIA